MNLKESIHQRNLFHTKTPGWLYSYFINVNQSADRCSVMSSYKESKYLHDRFSDMPVVEEDYPKIINTKCQRPLLVIRKTKSWYFRPPNFGGDHLSNRVSILQGRLFCFKKPYPL